MKLRAAGLIALSFMAGAPARAAMPNAVGGPIVGLGRPASRPLPRNFLGISLEFASVPAYFGPDPRDRNMVMARLIRLLSGPGTGTLRIGGDSSDRTWWPEPGLIRPAGASYALSVRWVATLRALADATHSRLMVGINLEANRPAVARAEARGMLALGRHRLAALEVGNEPELYSVLPWYRRPSGLPVRGRPPGYDFAAYRREFERIAAALPDLPVAAPATGDPHWLSGLESLAAVVPRLRYVTLHRYGLSRCIADPSSPRFPSVVNLLSAYASRTVMAPVARYVVRAHRRGLAFRVDELNSVTCGGVPGVSDTFASALWVLDSLFELARSGVDGVNIHIHPEAPANQLFTFSLRRGSWTGDVRPLFYGLLMFERAAPAGARILRSTVQAEGGLRIWGTRGADGTVRLLVIDPGASGARTLRLTVGHLARRCRLERLIAPGLGATHGVSIAGQAFGAATDGMLRGAPRLGELTPRRDLCRIHVPAASATLVTVSSRGSG
ncbi:MAG: glycosyl hydrolase family 79 C-terminal domain-containing protein [Solirubrobacteraceae bacterium]